MNKIRWLVSFSLAWLIATTADAQDKCSFQTIHAGTGPRAKDRQPLAPVRRWRRSHC